MTAGEDQNVDGLVHWEICLLAQLPLRHSGLVQTPPSLLTITELPRFGQWLTSSADSATQRVLAENHGLNTEVLTLLLAASRSVTDPKYFISFSALLWSRLCLLFLFVQWDRKGWPTASGHLEKCVPVPPCMRVLDNPVSCQYIYQHIFQIWGFCHKIVIMLSNAIARKCSQELCVVWMYWYSTLPFYDRIWHFNGILDGCFLYNTVLFIFNVIVMTYYRRTILLMYLIYVLYYEFS